MSLRTGYEALSLPVSLSSQKEKTIKVRLMNDEQTEEDADYTTVQKIINGDADAFCHILKRYDKHVLNIVKRHIPHNNIEEVAQDVFVRAFQSLSGFREKGKFKQWLSRIAHRTCYDFWRKKFKSKEIAISELSEINLNSLNSEFSYISDESFHEIRKRNEAAHLLEWALSKLSIRDRMIMELVYLEELSGKEVADLLGLSVANIKVRSYRIKKKLHGIILGRKED